MGRQTKHRKRLRKQRRARQREEKAHRQAVGCSGISESRDPRTRWSGLRAARGGHPFGFRGTGVKVSVDMDGENPPLEAVASLYGDQDQNFN